jgi:hypothetical protein
LSGTITTLLKAGSIATIIAITQWIAVYTLLEPWWKRGNHIGRSLVEFALYAMVTPALFIISLFFGVNRVTSQALAWVEVVLLCVLIPAGMVRRTRIWIRASRRGTRGKLPAGAEDKAPPEESSNVKVIPPEGKEPS